MLELLTDKAKLYGACLAAGLLFAALILTGAHWLGAKAALRAEVKAHAVTSGKLKAAEADLKTCRGNVESLNASLSRQNEAVAAFKAEAEAKARKAKQALDEARRASEAYRRKSVLIGKAPEPTGDRCKAAEDLLRANLGGDK